MGHLAALFIAPCPVGTSRAVLELPARLEDLVAVPCPAGTRTFPRDPVAKTLALPEGVELLTQLSQHRQKPVL